MLFNCLDNVAAQVSPSRNAGNGVVLRGVAMAVLLWLVGFAFAILSGLCRLPLMLEGVAVVKVDTPSSDGADLPCCYCSERGVWRCSEFFCSRLRHLWRGVFVWASVKERGN